MILDVNKNLKLLVALLIAIIVMFNISVYAENQLVSTNKTVEVTLDSVTLDSNNHVGNDWYYGATVNKEEINEGDKITLSLKSNGIIKLVASATENDKIPDVGQKQLSIPISKLKADKSNEYTLKVIVKENRGRYSGNTAQWLFKFIIKAK